MAGYVEGPLDGRRRQAPLLVPDGAPVARLAGEDLGVIGEPGASMEQDQFGPVADHRAA